jgi:Protein of unknown function (DUF2490)
LSGDHTESRLFRRIREGSHAGIAVAISRRVMERTSQRGSQEVVEMGMRGLTRFARHLVPSALVVCVMSLGAPCAAQENVDAPTVPAGPDLGDGRGSLFAPSAWLVLSTPVRKQIDLKLYGFYIGDLNVPVTQVDIPLRATKFLTVTPSYMYYSVPASGLNELSPHPGGFTDSYEEHQFRVDGTVAFAVRKFEISARNMYVRRFRPAPADDMNRYRGRIAIAHPLAVQGRIWKPFASYETFYERPGGWNRERIWTGVTLPLTKHVLFQPSYMWEISEGSRAVDYLLFGLIVNTK